MQMYRLAVLLPELVEEARKQILLSLDSFPELERTPRGDENHFRIVFMALKCYWANIPIGVAIEDDILAKLPSKPRYTEVLVQSNALIITLDPHYPDIPIVKWNNGWTRVDQILEVYTCEEIHTPLDGDDYRESLIMSGPQGHTVIGDYIDNVMTHFENAVYLGEIFNVATNVHGRPQMQILN